MLVLVVHGGRWWRLMVDGGGGGGVSTQLGKRLPFCVWRSCGASGGGGGFTKRRETEREKKKRGRGLSLSTFHSHAGAVCMMGIGVLARMAKTVVCRSPYFISSPTSMLHIKYIIFFLFLGSAPEPKSDVLDTSPSHLPPFFFLPSPNVLYVHNEKIEQEPLRWLRGDAGGR